MSAVYFDIRDISRAARMGWAPRRILTAAVGLLLAHMLWMLCAYAAVAVDGHISLLAVWNELGFFPWAVAQIVDGGGTFLFVTGVVLAWLVMMGTFSAVAKQAVRELKGDVGLGGEATMNFVGRHGTTAATAVMVLTSGIVLMLFAGLLLGMTGRVAVVGELLVGLLSLPTILCGVAAFGLIAVIFIEVTIGPAVVATLEDDWLEVTVQAAAVLWGQPFRWLAYELWLAVISGATVLAATVVLLFGSLASLAVVGRLIPLKIAGMMVIASEYVPGLEKLFWAFNTGRGPVEVASGIPIAAAGGVFAVSLLVLMVVVAAYGISTWGAGQTLIKHRHLTHYSPMMSSAN